MLGIRLQDCIRNTEIRRRTKVEDIIGRITTLKWKWAEDDDRRTIRLVNWRSRGRPATRWSDDIGETFGEGLCSAVDSTGWMITNCNTQ